MFILASKRVMPQRMGGEPQISAHPSNQKEKKEKKSAMSELISRVGAHIPETPLNLRYYFMCY